MTVVTDTAADHIGMMVKLSRRAQARLERAGFAADFDDLMQEAQITFLKAKEGFDPQKNVKFSTYLWNAIGNNLNRQCDKVRDAQRGAVSIDSKLGSDDDSGSLMDIIEDKNAEDPQVIIERSQNVARTLSQFSPATRRVLTLFVTQPDALMKEVQRIRAFYDLSREQGFAAPRVKFGVDIICDILGYRDADRRSVKAEIKDFMEAQ